MSDGARPRRAAGDGHLVGRAEELEAVLRVLRAAGTGTGGAVVVRGEPGIGKSALLAAALDACDARVLFGQADLLGMERPFGVLLEAVEVEDRAGEVETGEAILSAIASHCALGGVVLAVDDLHWADDASLKLMQRLARLTDVLPLVFATALRPHRLRREVRRLLAELTRWSERAEVALGPLGDRECRVLTESLLGARPTPDVMRQVAMAGGNPQFVEDIVSTLVRDRLIEITADGAALLDTTMQPPVVPRLGEADFLSGEARHLVGLAAVLGTAFTPWELCVVTGRSMTEILPPVREAVDAGVLTEASEHRLAFRHDVVHRTLYDELPRPVRTELHRDMARALHRAGASADVVAAHVLRGSLFESDLEWVARVASGALRESPTTSLAVWERLRSEVPATNPLASEAEIGIAVAQLAAGQLRQAEGTARRLIEGITDPGHAGTLWLCLSTSLFLQGRWSELRTVAHAGSTAPELFPAERADQVSVLGLGALMAGDFPRALDAANRADHASRVTGNRRARVRSLVVRGHLAHCAGRLGDADLLLRDAASRLGPDEGVDAIDTIAPAFHALALVDLDRMAEALEIVQRLRAAARDRSTRRAPVFASLSEADVLFEGGHLAQSLTLVAALAALGEDAQAWETAQNSRRAVLALFQEGPGTAEKWLSRIHEDAAAPGRGMSMLPRVRAAVLAERGDGAGALRELWQGWTACARRGVLVDLVPLGLELADTAHGEGDVEKGSAAVQALTELAAANPQVPSLAAAARSARGLARGEARELAEAAEMWLGSSRTLLAARAAELAAGRLAASSRRVLAHELAIRAYEAYSAAGATYRANAVRTVVRATGAGTRRRAPTRPTSGWGALTRTERIVARYVELGHSNGEIAERLVISRRTVESHVSHILAKLGLRSRSALIIAAAQDGRIPEQAAPSDLARGREPPSPEPRLPEPPSPEPPLPEPPKPQPRRPEQRRRRPK